VLGWNCKIVVQSRRFAVIDICDYIIISGICCNWYRRINRKEYFCFHNVCFAFFIVCKVIAKRR